MSRRPALFVLAGVNGAGKSSVGGHLLSRGNVDWFNPDDFARDLVSLAGCSQTDANAQAWRENVRRIDAAIAAGESYAFETTLGGRTISARIREAAKSHDVFMWYCALSTPEQHIERVRARVAAGGHDIPEARIRERFVRAPLNLIALMPDLARLKIFDNSADAAPGESVPDPVLLLEMRNARLHWPAAEDVNALQQIPVWAKSLMEAAIRYSEK